VVPWVALLAASGGTANPGWNHIPGGVRAYEHQWAMAAAFDYHLRVLHKAEVQARIRTLTSKFRAELERLPNVHVVTPIQRCLTSALICLDVPGQTAADVVMRLESGRVVASTSAPDPSGTQRTHVRFGISVVNTAADIERAVAVLCRL